MHETPRLRVEELPPRETSGLQYRLAVRVGDRREEHALPQQETILGRAERCDVQVEAAGVRGRHLCLKRNGDRLFARAIGDAQVQWGPRDDEKDLEEDLLDNELRPVDAGQPLHFGAARAVVRRLEPTDRRAAVEVPSGTREQADVKSADVEPVPVRARLGDEAGRASEEAERQLRQMNAALARAAQHQMGPEALLEALYDCLAPPASALFRQSEEQQQGGARWACLAVHGSVAPPAPPSAADGWACFERKTATGRFALVARLQASEQPVWRDALCRHVVLMAALLHRCRSSDRRSPEGDAPLPDAQASSRSGAVWDDFVGSEMRAHLRQSTGPCRYARSVLVLGETGTGKELAAGALHHRLWQRDGPLVALNCAAVPEDLLDAELFGVEEGAATGVDARPGRFEQACGGTLFLDEVAEMPLPLQSKLLRVLQERTYFRLGGTELLEADARIVAASNRPEPALREGGSHMRPDLYFRLAQATLILPPLRERPGDLPALCEHFLTQLERRFERGVRGVSVAALQPMQRYPWPGNVRELKNVLRTIYARTPPGELAARRHLPEALRRNATTDGPGLEEREAKTAPLTPEASPPGASSPGEKQPKRDPLPEGESLSVLVRDTERRAIERELARRPRVADAAEALDLSTSYLYRKIKDLGIERDELE